MKMPGYEYENKYSHYNLSLDMFTQEKEKKNHPHNIMKGQSDKGLLYCVQLPTKNK